MIIFSGVSQRLTAIYIPIYDDCDRTAAGTTRIKLSYFILVCNRYNNNNTHIYIYMHAIIISGIICS